MSARRALGVTLVATIGALAIPTSLAADVSRPEGTSDRPRIEGPQPEPIEPPAASEVEASIRRGIDFLLRTQNRNGSWGSPRRTKGLNIYAPAPGAHHAFRSACTALCVAALIEVDDGRDETRAAIRRGIDWLRAELPRLRRATPDAIYNVWGHAYSIEALVRAIEWRHAPVGARRELERLIESQIELLDRYESVDGGWGYYDFRVGTKKPSASSISFTTATVLVAFHEARSIGIDVPERLVRRAVASIRRQQKPDLSYLYGEYLKARPMRGINRPGGSLGRSQACNLALRLWGDARITDEALRTWLDRLFARQLWLDIGRKRPIPHEAWFQVAGYFYYYGHYYAARCIEQLPPDARATHRAHLARRLLDRQERDGSWWDFPFYDYHQPYGTGFALSALTRCR